uniref:Uncharacterized protein n=1 Tax=Arundo donax TaxID=35708 RepID=A0A0A9G0U9_ARUDO
MLPGEATAASAVDTRISATTASAVDDDSSVEGAPVVTSLGAAPAVQELYSRGSHRGLNATPGSATTSRAGAPTMAARARYCSEGGDVAAEKRTVAARPWSATAHQAARELGEGGCLRAAAASRHLPSSPWLRCWRMPMAMEVIRGEVQQVGTG